MIGTEKVRELFVVVVVVVGYFWNFPKLQGANEFFPECPKSRDVKHEVIFLLFFDSSKCCGAFLRNFER